MEVAVDVWLTAEVPDHFRTLNLPGVPDLVAADVVLAVVIRDKEVFDHLLVGDGLERGGDIVAAEHGQHLAHSLGQEVLLIAAQVRAAETREILFFHGDHGVGPFLARFGFGQRLRLLFAVQPLYKLVEDLALVPVGVAGMVFGFIEVLGEVPIKNGAATKAVPLVTVGMATPGHMVSGVDELKVTVRWRPEESDRRGVLGFSILVDQNLVVDRLAMWLAVQRVKDGLD